MDLAHRVVERPRAAGGTSQLDVEEQCDRGAAPVDAEPRARPAHRFALFRESASGSAVRSLAAPAREALDETQPGLVLAEEAAAAAQRLRVVLHEALGEPRVAV